eukprot:CAMPEP_0178995348 /NCGR_PEP_ID=MMETSP0795-20121207/7783_1 /TAXON_ID=88552 /ORGANISM="Amoebophrya sp., Strain Ameob2" /LENGTH=828 /DNA_ID=CAMNT_0020687657 /DNA_START=332 /DNA_END=2818 /DNA_ORIENTATION=-
MVPREDPADGFSPSSRGGTQSEALTTSEPTSEPQQISEEPSLPLPTSVLRMQEALKEFGEGKFVLVMDSADRENECDLIIAAEHCTPAQMAFMIRKSTGIVCVTTGKERLERFGLHPATGKNTDPNGTNFYVSTDYLGAGVTTGVSAKDRVATIRAFCDIKNGPEMFSKPGHMFPLCANPEGVYARQGHTEATFDFCRLAPNVKHPVGALAELMNDDGEMLRDGDSRAFAEEHNILMVYVSDIIEYRRWLDAKTEVHNANADDAFRAEGYITRGPSREVAEVERKMSGCSGTSTRQQEQELSPECRGGGASGTHQFEDGVLMGTNNTSKGGLKKTTGSVAPTSTSSTATSTSDHHRSQSVRREDFDVASASVTTSSLPKATSTSGLSSSALAKDASATLFFDALSDLPTRMIVKPGPRGSETVILVVGDVNHSTTRRVPVRIHSECFTGDTLGSRMCDCGQQLNAFKRIMAEEKLGVLIYLKGHEGRGIGLYNKIRAYELQVCQEVDTVEANRLLGFANDYRNFGDAVCGLRELGVRKIALYTNNPEKERIFSQGSSVEAGFEFDVLVQSLPTSPNEHNFRYLETKKHQLRHRTIMETFNLEVQTPTFTSRSEVEKLAALEKSPRTFTSPPEEVNEVYPKNREQTNPEGVRVCPLTSSAAPSLTGVRILIVSTKWNENLLLPIVTACKRYLQSKKVNVEWVQLPGHLDLLAGTKALLSRKRNPPDAVVVLGMLLPNDLKSDVHALEGDRSAIVSSLLQLTLFQEKPIVQGVMWCESEEHARRKAEEGSNPGKAYGQSALYMVKLQLGISEAETTVASPAETYVPEREY